MLSLRFLLKITSGAIIVAGAAAYAQDYPTKPLRLVTSGVGGISDLSARTVAQGITGPLGQPVIVDNRGQILSIETVAKAQPDGYTLLVQGGGVWLTPLLTKASWDPVKDLSPISQVYAAPNLLLVHPSIAATSVKELIALAKAKPGELNYGSGASGSSSHIAMELFKSMAGVNIVRVPYKATGMVITGLLSGEVQMTIEATAAMLPAIKAGKIKALAVTSAQPSDLYPGLPTVAATGLPGFESVSINGVFAPAKTPVSIINRLNQEIVRALNTEQAKKVFLAAGVEVAAGTPAQLAAKVKSEIVRLGKVIKDAGINAD